MTIWKYPVYMQDEFSIDMPPGAKILSVQIQGDSPQMWAMVEEESFGRTQRRRFKVVGTGHPITEDGLAFIGTFQLRGGSLVFHLFEAN